MLKPLAGCWAIVATCVAPVASVAQGAPSLAIEARLFESATGRLSDDVLAPGGRPLGNVVMGEQASTSTLVVVRVVSEGPLPVEARLRLVANETSKAGARTLLDSIVPVPPQAASGVAAYVGFWLADTGCAPIALRAELLAPEAPTVSRDAALGFTCNE